MTMEDAVAPRQVDNALAEAPKADLPAEAARRLIRSLDRAALATAQRDRAAWPYPSLVLVACDLDATPILLLSQLAEHTRNLQSDNRVGLLFDGTVGLTAPLAGGRVTVLGRATPTDRPDHRRRYLARHPEAAMFADFGDFAFYTVEIESVHLVGGFGRVHWIEGAQMFLAVTDGAAWHDQEAAVIDDLNQNQGAALHRLALSLPEHGALLPALLSEPGAEQEARWRVTGLDPEGGDLRREGRVARVVFNPPVASPDAARAAVLALAGRSGAAGRSDGE